MIGSAPEKGNSVGTDLFGSAESPAGVDKPSSALFSRGPPA
jgi:hypothetical protein